MTPSDQGAFFSANDQVLPWAIAFLHSFRESNPDLPLYLIPFNDECDQLLRVANSFDFRVYTDPSFADLEEMGSRYELGFTPHGKYWFRRYAAFWGPLERFVYLDARQLVLGDFRPLLRTLAESELDLIHFDTAINQVYEPGLLRRRLLLDRRGQGFNSGRWLARRGAFSLDEMIALGNASLQERDQLNPRNTDQGFINYCCDHKPVRSVHIADWFDDVCRNAWARQPGSIYRDRNGVYRLWDHGGLDHQKRVLLVHWAGIGLGTLMPRRRLFLRYAVRDAPLWRRVKTYLTDAVRWPALVLVDRLRRQRLTNRAWKWATRGK